MVLIAIKNLFQDKGRLLISVGGTAFAILLMVIINAILAGTLKQSVAYMNKVGADIFVTQKGVSNMLTSISVLPVTVKSRLESFPGVNQVSPIYGTPFSFEVGNKKTASYLIGFDPKKELGGPWKIAAGEAVPGDDQVVVDEVLAKNNNVSIGDTVELAGEEFHIVGLSAETNSIGSQYIFITKKDAGRLMLASNTVNYFLLTVNEPDIASETAAQLERKITGINAYTREDFSRYNLQVVEDILAPPLQLMAWVSFFIGVMVIGLTVYTATLAKINEFAVLKAIGASNRHLFLVVFLQAAIGSILGFLTGCLISLGLIKLINAIGIGVTAALEPQVLLQVFGLTFLMSLLASFIPVKNVASIDPASVFKA